MGVAAGTGGGKAWDASILCNRTDQLSQFRRFVRPYPVCVGGTEAEVDGFGQVTGVQIYGIGKVYIITYR